jgi:hypothetical protein
MPPCCADDCIHIRAGTAVESAGLKAKTPHHLVWSAMCADDTCFLEFCSETMNLEHLRQIEVYNNDVGKVLDHVMTNLFYVASDDNILKMRMKTCSKALSDGAVSLCNNNRQWMHGNPVFYGAP